MAVVVLLKISPPESSILPLPLNPRGSRFFDGCSSLVENLSPPESSILPLPLNPRGSRFFDGCSSLVENLPARIIDPATPTKPWR
jgi:hypothetical protein